MTRADVLAQYTGRAKELETCVIRANAQFAPSGAAAAGGLIAAIALAFHGQWWFAGLLAGASVVAGRRFLTTRSQADRYWRLKRFYERALQRISGEWAGTGVTGEEFSDPQHPYAQDLNLFGEGSLFELLAIGRSGIGRRGLAKLLLDAGSLSETRARQEAVRELAGRADLREKAALLGPHSFSQSNWETFAQWLESPVSQFPRGLNYALPVTSAVLALIALAAGGTLIPPLLAMRLAAILLIIHAILGQSLHDRVRRTIRAVSSLPGETEVLREGLALIESERWNSPRLQEISARTSGGAASVRKLEKLLGRLAARNNDVLYLPSLLLMMGTQLSMAIETWRRKHGAELRIWMDAWAEFEALNALACYAFENPANAFAEFVEGRPEEACFEAKALGHPLLPYEACVRNDVALNADTRFFIISCSNMSGKSTLLRAIGLSAVLAAAGAPVRAERLRVSSLAVCASISVADSLLNGKSKFLAEVDRLRLAIERAGHGDGSAAAVLFLIDEIFSGTNSPDRRAAAEAVVRTLIGRGAIGALSTHDLALAEIAEDPALGGANVHMGSRGQGDPMDFDYLLKPGVTQEANALAIARMAGVPV